MLTSEQLRCNMVGDLLLFSANKVFDMCRNIQAQFADVQSGLQLSCWFYNNSLCSPNRLYVLP